MYLRGAELRNFYEITLRNEVDDKSKQKPFMVSVRIPCYQRPYVWKSENVSQLIRDVVNNIAVDMASNKNQDEIEYFSGAVVSSTQTKEVHELVDGQQRYTTLFIINYCLFLMTRIKLRELLKSRHNMIDVTSMLRVLKKSMQYVFVDSLGSKITSNLEISEEMEKMYNKYTEDPDFFNTYIYIGFDERKKSDFDKLLSLRDNNNDRSSSSVFDKIDELLEMINRQERKENKTDEERENNRLEALECFYNLGLISDNEDENEMLLSEMFDCYTVRINYARRKYNRLFSESLKSVDFRLDDYNQNKFSLKFYDDYEDCVFDDESENRNGYLIAINSVFNEIDNLGLSSFDTINSLVKILETLKVCVVQTGSKTDANILFDVLNDRAVELDSLSLIKNEFYKKLVIENEKLPSKKIISDERIDSYIDKIDSAWVSDIFGHANYYDNLISFFGSVYLSGNTATTNNSKEVKKTIFNYIDNNETYSYNNLSSDVSVFKLVRIILDKVGVQHRDRPAILLLSEISCESMLKRTTKLLMAKGQDAILSGLICYVISYLFSLDLGNLIDNSKSAENALDEIFGNPEHIVNKQAFQFWIASLSHNNHIEPRKLAISVISSHHRGKLFDNEVKNIDGSCRKSMKENLENWRFSSTEKSQINVKVLLLNLFMRNNEARRTVLSLSSDMVTTFKDPKNYHLDHFEPKTLPEGDNDGRFYVQEDRDYLVNSLGNMMPLPRTVNIKKSNSPTKDAKLFYSKDELLYNNHMLKQLINIYDENIDDNSVPTREFFTRRKKILVEDIVSMVFDS